jgi:capsular polysaccharide biosynthesis protein
MKELTPLEQFERVWRRWWLIPLLILLGGGLGWAYRFIQPPLYQARSTMLVEIDYTQTGTIEEFERDQILISATAILYSPTVLDQVAADLERQGISPSALRFGRTIFFERQQTKVFLVARNPDRQTAKIVAQTWAERGYAALLAAQMHAIRAQSLQQYAAALQTCPTPPPVDPAPPSLCGQTSLAEVQQALETVNAQIGQESQASLGMLPAIVISQPQEGLAPGDPVIYHTPWLILAGATLGGLVGIYLAGAAVGLRTWLRR